MLRETIRLMLEDEMSKNSAGIVVIRRFNDSFKVLCLKRNEKFDITKGLIEPGESPINAAIRETAEEAGITDLDFEWGSEPLAYGKGFAYIASTEQDPIILPNPISGILEHTGYQWLTFEEALESLPEYLLPAIHYAESLVNKA